MQFWNGRRKRSVWKGAVAGAIGGLVGSWTMNQFQNLWSKASEAMDSESRRSSNGRERQQEQEENPTVKTAEFITRKIAGKRLRSSQKERAGALVHYGFGTALGAVYGAVAERVPQISSVWGLPYGTAVFVGADEAALPALGLTKSLLEYPASKHAYALTSHFVYGATLESIRRLLRR